VREQVVLKEAGTRVAEGEGTTGEPCGKDIKREKAQQGCGRNMPIKTFCTARKLRRRGSKGLGKR